MTDNEKAVIEAAKDAVVVAARCVYIGEREKHHKNAKAMYLRTLQTALSNYDYALTAGTEPEKPCCGGIRKYGQHSDGCGSIAPAPLLHREEKACPVCHGERGIRGVLVCGGCNGTGKIGIE